MRPAERVPEPNGFDLSGRWFAGRGRAAVASVWPDSRDELLLKSALLDGEAARRAWRSWSDGMDLGRVDGRSAQILPLVYRNLTRGRPMDPSLEALKPHYRFTWARNQQVFRRLNASLGRLHAAEIETLVAKGAALIPCYYRDAGARGMGDFDVLVREDRFHDALDELRDMGWLHHYWEPEHFDTRFKHAINLLDAEGFSIDLHCHLLMYCCAPGDDANFWEGSRPVVIAGVETRTLCATDHLIQACVHGLNWVKDPPLRWVADAVTLLRSEEGIDWERLIRTSSGLKLTIQVVESLGYLERTFGPLVPADVVARLRAVPVTSADRQRFQLGTKNRRGHPLALFLHHYHIDRKSVV